MAKGIKTGGRQKGTVNKSNEIVEDIAREMGFNPFKVLMLFAAGDWKSLGYDAECYFSEKADGAVKMGYVISPETRMKAASDATKYLYSQKKAIEVSTSGEGFKIIVEDYTKSNE